MTVATTNGNTRSRKSAAKAATTPETVEVLAGQIKRMADADGVITGTVSNLPSKADYLSARSAFQSSQGKAAGVLLEIVKAEAWDMYVEDGTPAALFADFLGGMALPGKSEVRNEIIIRLEAAGESQQGIADMLNMSKPGVRYVLQSAKGALPPSKQGVTSGEGDADDDGQPADKTGGKAKVTATGLVRIPAFDVTTDNAVKLARYLAKMGITIELPEADDAE